MDGILPHGKTDPGIIREIFEARKGDWSERGDHVEDILETYLMYLIDEVETSSTYRVLPGITRLLRRLEGRADVLLGLATGNIERGARIKLERGDLNRYFKFGGFGSDSEDRTLLVRRAAELAQSQCGRCIPSDDVFVIGDTPRDIDAGRGAGFCTVGVGTGRFTTAELSDAGATLVLEDFEQNCDQFLMT